MVTNIRKTSLFFVKEEAIAVQILFVFIKKKSLQCENYFCYDDEVYKGYGRERNEKDCKSVPRRRVQKVVIVQLTINRNPLNQSDSSNFAPLTITYEIID